MSEISVLRKVCGAKRDEAICERRRLHNEEIYDLYSLPKLFRVIKYRRMKWEVNVGLTRDIRGEYMVLVGRLEGKIRA